MQHLDAEVQCVMGPNSTGRFHWARGLCQQKGKTQLPDILVRGILVAKQTNFHMHTHVTQSTNSANVATLYVLSSRVNLATP